MHDRVAKVRGLARRFASHPGWLPETVRLARDRREYARSLAGFSLDDYGEFIADEADAVAAVLGTSSDAYREAVAGLWKPREAAATPRYWDARDALLNIVGAVVRLARPDRMVETGVARGYTTATALAAMDANGRGHLYSVDLPPLSVDSDFVGQVVPDGLRERWTLELGPSRAVLPQVAGAAAPIDVFLHDADHTYPSQLSEYRTVWPHLRAGGILLSDDVSNPAFVEFAGEVGATPVLVKRHANTAFGLIRKP